MKDGLIDLWKIQTDEANRMRQGAIYEIAWILLHNPDYYKASICGFRMIEWNKWVDSHFKRDPKFCASLQLEHAELTMTSLPIHPPPAHQKWRMASLEEYANYANPSFTLEQRQSEVWSVWKNDSGYAALEYASDIAKQFGRLYKILEFKRRAFYND
jgi:hypothetical protein